MPELDKAAVRQALLDLTDIAKNQYELIVSTMVELAALRESVQGLDPTFADILPMRRDEALQKVLPSTKDLVERLEKLSEKLKAGEDR